MEFFGILVSLCCLNTAGGTISIELFRNDAVNNAYLATLTDFSTHRRGRAGRYLTHTMRSGIDPALHVCAFRRLWPVVSHDLAMVFPFGNPWLGYYMHRVATLV